MRFRALNSIYSVLRRTNTLLGVVAATFAASLKADTGAIAANLGAWPATAVAFMQAWAWLVTPGVLLAIPLLDWVRRLNGDPKVWRIVHDVLDAFRDKVIDSDPNDEIHQHRVTLFRHSGWAFVLRRWPWSGWLVPVERSGHTTQKTDIIFRAPDDADHAEGIAGLTWSRNKVVYVEDLPDLSSDGSEAAIELYALRSHMSPSLVRQRRPRARSLCGIPVEVNGQLWGAIVVDSRHPKLLEAELRGHYTTYARFLGKTLEGV